MLIISETGGYTNNKNYLTVLSFLKAAKVNMKLVDIIKCYL